MYVSDLVSCLMYGSADYCRLQIYLVTQAHVSLALCPNRPLCIWCYMQLPIAFWDNQQISLADSTLPLNRNCLLQLTYGFVFPCATLVPVLDQLSFWTSPLWRLVMVWWTSLQGSPPQLCDRDLWLLSQLVCRCSGGKYRCVLSSFPLLD